MSFLVSKTTATVIDENAIDIQKALPFGIWEPVFDQFRGVFFQRCEYKLDHGKIYGKSQKIADHIYQAFKKSTDNVGALLSGGKGLGKSLTARLVIEQAVNDKIPVIIVGEYIPSLVNILKNVSNSVILFDEFEKTFAGKCNENNEGAGLTKQEEILSLLDGTAVGLHNLYLMTINDTSKINENLKSRPGRIKYHYQYESEDEAAIRAYCADHLQKKEFENEIVDSLLATRYVSIDIIKALVSEINDFDVTVDEAMEYLNIETSRVRVKGRITFSVYGKTKTSPLDFGNYLSGMPYINTEFESTSEEDRAGEEYYFGIKVPMKGKKIPVFGTLDVSNDVKIIDYQEDIGDPEKKKFLAYKVEIFEEGQGPESNYKLCGAQPQLMI